MTKSFDNIPYLHRVQNIETGEVFEVYAKNKLDAISKVPDYEAYKDYYPFRVEEILTTEGHRITLLRYLAKGDYFNVVMPDITARADRLFTNTHTYVRDEYDRSTKKYYATYLHDAKRLSLHDRNTRVTIDVIF